MFNKKSVVDQVTSHLHDELIKGRWTGMMPGRDRLAAELGVHGSTIERALKQLEKEGLIQAQGAGKRRLITTKNKSWPSTRVCVVLYEREDALNNYILELQNRLTTDGHLMTFSTRTLRELKFEPERIAAMLQTHSAEAYIVMAATRPILEKLLTFPKPVFALFGRMTGLPLAGTGPDKLPALRDAMERLHKNGHRRIVLLTRGGKQRSNMGLIEQTFVEELEKWNLPHGAYNLPEWENSPEGLHQCLYTLFQITPPTALIVDDWLLMHGLQTYLARAHGQAFRDVVTICTDYHSCFAWCKPMLPHFEWDHLVVVRRACRWVNNIARGKDDRKQLFVKARFIDGGTLGGPIQPVQ